MIPVPIPEDRLWQGAQRIVVGPPSGDPTDDTIRPVEAVSETTEIGHVFRMLIQLEPGDIERLQQDPHFWVSIFALRLPPFDVATENT